LFLTADNQTHIKYNFHLLMLVYKTARLINWNNYLCVNSRCTKIKSIKLQKVFWRECNASLFIHFIILKNVTYYGRYCAYCRRCNYVPDQ